ncbi:hypothetical protein [uncultured Dubosiella sp.]|uniref:hypothetical protein n=1 Tax=uncultured Dubosiella sp. TaxID=1937011 RepID=UPI00261F740A|nr:hypothetical protein [uncultured Dubosiella sp.]
MKNLSVILAVSMGIVLSQPIPCGADTTIIKAVEDESIPVPARISIKTGQPSAQVQAEIICTDPSTETQTDEAVADDTGRATIHYGRVDGMSYAITLTVNGGTYTMRDDNQFSPMCDDLTVEGIRAGVDDKGMQTLTVTVSLADVPETPSEMVDPKPVKPEPEEPAEDDKQKKENLNTPKKEDAKPHEKDSMRDSAQVQNVKVDSTIAQGMPTGIQVWNPISWFLSLFRVCL